MIHSISYQKHHTLSLDQTKETMDNNQKGRILSSNGNILFVEKLDQRDAELSSLGSRAYEIFQSLLNIDSIIFLIQKEDSENTVYDFFICERDGTFSNFCGNGVGASMKYLFDAVGVKTANFITKEGDTVGATLGENRVQIHVGKPKELQVEEYQKALGVLQKEIEKKIDAFCLFPENVAKHTYNENYTVYFLQMFSSLQGDTNFFNFVKNICMEGMYTIAGEPHIIIRIPVIFEEHIRDYYLKAVSFLIKSEIGFHTGNCMFFYEYEGKYYVYPHERGVWKGITVDGTGSCGSGTCALGYHIAKIHKNHEVAIVNRSGRELRVSVDTNGEVSFSYPEEYICEVVKEAEKGEECFYADAVYETWCYKMQRDLGKNVTSLSYEEVLSSIEHEFPEFSKKMHEIFGNILFTTCLHEQEFPIDPYKISSTVFGSKLAHLLKMDFFQIYLDTMTKKFKGFPNIDIHKAGGKRKFFQHLSELVCNISSSIEHSSDVKSIIAFIKYRIPHIISGNASQLQRTISEENPIYASVVEIEDMFASALGFEKRHASTKYYMFVMDIARRIGWYDYVTTAFEKHYHFSQKDREHFIFWSLDSIISKNFVHIFKKFFYQLLRYYPKKVRNKEEYEKVFYKCIQDAVVSHFFENFLSKDTKEMFHAQGILNKKGMFSPSISSLERDFTKKFSKSFEILFSYDFGKSLFFRYLDIILEKTSKKSVLLGEFQPEGYRDTVFVFAVKEEGEIKFFIGSSPSNPSEVEIEKEFFLQLLTSGEYVINFQGCLQLLVCTLGNVPVIGSERGYRELVIEVLKQYNFEKTHPKYLACIQSLHLTGDYVPSKTMQGSAPEEYYFMFPAGTDNSFTGDLLMDSLFFPSLSSKKGKEFLQNVFKRNTCTHDDMDLIVSDSIYTTQNYNYMHLGEVILERVPQQYDQKRKRVEDMMHRATKSDFDALVNRYVLLKQTGNL